MFDLRQLWYFMVTAQECNLHRAAARLCISQPPLSRQIKALEESLGLTLFVRHSRGLTLTADGAALVELAGPLLQQEEQTRLHVSALARSAATAIGVGFTTGFEQGLFTPVEALLHQHYGRRLRIVRGTSPKLLREVRRGKLTLAFVALPLSVPSTQALQLLPLPYEEPLVAVLPTLWPEAQQEHLSLNALSGRPLFWFRREANLDFFDASRRVFIHTGFMPQYLEEPLEHDVLLARIAAGEGMGLFPASFAAIQREGVVFIRIAEGAALQVQLGCAFVPASVPTASPQISPDVLQSTASAAAQDLDAVLKGVVQLLQTFAKK